MGGNHLSHDWRYIDAAKVWPSGKAHLNATLPVNDPAAGTEFTYLTTDGSDDAPYLKA